MERRDYRWRVLLAAAFGMMLACVAITATPEAPSPDRVRALLDEVRYAEAESAARALVEDVEDATGEESTETAAALNLLGNVLFVRGKYGESRSAFERALSFRETTPGPDHLDVAESVSDLGLLLVEQNEYEDAVQFQERALGIREGTLGSEHPLVAETLTRLGVAIRLTGDYDRPLELHERALRTQENVLGRYHPDTATTLVAIGKVYYVRGDHEIAARYYRSALEIRESVLGPDHPSTAASLLRLGTTAFSSAALEEGRSLYERALAIQERAFGPDHPAVAETLRWLADLYGQEGDFVTSRRLHERSLDILERVHGPWNDELALRFNNLGQLVEWSGEYERAIELYDRATTIWERSRPLHYFTGAGTLNAGRVRSLVGEYEAADRLLERAQVILEEALGSEHVFMTEVQRDRGQLAWWWHGDEQRAGMLLRRSVELSEATFGPDHPWTADKREALASFLLESGSPGEAGEQYQQAVATFERSLGPDHPFAGSGLQGFALASLRTGDRPAAMEAALRAEEIGREHLRLTASSLSERQALRYASVRASGLNVALSVCADGCAEDRLRAAWDSLIRSRALILDELAVRNRSVGMTPKAQALGRELASARRRFANLAMRGPGDKDPEQYRAFLDRAREEKESAERALAEESVTFRLEMARRRIGLPEVAAALPRGSALVAYARYDRFPHVGGTDSGGDLGPEPSYAALVLASASGSPVVLPLGPAAEIDRLVANWRGQASTPPPPLSASSAPMERLYREAGAALRQAIWDPVSTLLEETDRVFVVPDGGLHLLTLATLPTVENRYLLETGPEIHLLSAEKDLVPAERTDVGTGLLAMGGADFDAMPGGRPGEARTESTALREVTATVPVPTVYRGLSPGCRDFRATTFEPLPGTLKEVASLAELWRGKAAGEPAQDMGQAVSLTGSDADERSFKTLSPGRRTLHLATHGFFLNGQCPSATPGRRGIGGLSSVGEHKDDRGPESPLVLSGLAMAGANNRARAGPEDEDGILTAEEIASVDLSTVEWVVLSGCDTATGSIVRGEGVFGLRRAAEIAGAGTLIMSLWSVEDQSARDWMRELYEARLVDGLSTATSVREASLRVLEARRKAGRTTHPFYWGAFVAAGDWR